MPQPVLQELLQYRLLFNRPQHSRLRNRTKFRLHRVHHPYIIRTFETRIESPNTITLQLRGSRILLHVRLPMLMTLIDTMPMRGSKRILRNRRRPIRVHIITKRRHIRTDMLTDRLPQRSQSRRRVGLGHGGRYVIQIGWTARDSLQTPRPFSLGPLEHYARVHLRASTVFVLPYVLPPLISKSAANLSDSRLDLVNSRAISRQQPGNGERLQDTHLLTNTLAANMSYGGGCECTRRRTRVCSHRWAHLADFFDADGGGSSYGNGYGSSGGYGGGSG